MTRVVAVLPGYASVARASDVLHLAPRSIRDLIYSGRLPSLRVGRLHYIRTADLELERRRRLGKPLPQPRVSQARRTPRRPQAAAAGVNVELPSMPSERPHADQQLRRQRAAERAELVSRWAQRHASSSPRVPATVLRVSTPVTCAICGRQVRSGRIVELTPEPAQPAVRLCVTCGRRALLEWADRRRLEAAAARQLSHSLGEPQGEVPEEETQTDFRAA